MKGVLFMVKFGGITEWVANRVAEIVGPQSKDGQVYTAEVEIINLLSCLQILISLKTRNISWAL